MTEEDPIFLMLTKRPEMSEGEIVCHINSWFFGLDGRELFEEAKNSGKIIKNPDTREWMLADPKLRPAR